MPKRRKKKPILPRSFFVADQDRGEVDSFLARCEHVAAKFGFRFPSYKRRWVRTNEPGMILKERKWNFYARTQLCQINIGKLQPIAFRKDGKNYYLDDFAETLKGRPKVCRLCGEEVPKSGPSFFIRGTKGKNFTLHEHCVPGFLGFEPEVLTLCIDAAKTLSFYEGRVGKQVDAYFSPELACAIAAEKTEWFNNNAEFDYDFWSNLKTQALPFARTLIEGGERYDGLRKIVRKEESFHLRAKNTHTWVRRRKNRQNLSVLRKAFLPNMLIDLSKRIRNLVPGIYYRLSIEEADIPRRNLEVSHRFGIELDPINVEVILAQRIWTNHARKMGWQPLFRSWLIGPDGRLFYWKTRKHSLRVGDLLKIPSGRITSTFICRRTKEWVHAIKGIENEEISRRGPERHPGLVRFRSRLTENDGLGDQKGIEEPK